jgi:hypothetical protein
MVAHRRPAYQTDIRMLSLSPKRDNLIYQLGTTLNILVPDKPRYLHVTVAEHIDFNALPYNGNFDQNAIRTLAIKHIVDVIRV